jgi:hypothetical protein
MLRSKAAIQRLLVLPVRDLFLGLPLEQIQKVIPTPTIIRGGQSSLGLIRVESKDVMVLDLHQILYRQPNLTSEPYLVLVKTTQGRTYGVPTIALPLIEDIRANQITPLLQDYRDRDPLGIASHTALVARNETMQTIFLVDADDLWVRLESMGLATPLEQPV